MSTGYGSARKANIQQGYIGGTAFAQLYKAHPDYDYTLLVRNEERAKPVREQYQNVKFAYGGLDDSEVVEKAAAEADIVVRMFGTLHVLIDWPC